MEMEMEMEMEQEMSRETEGECVVKMQERLKSLTLASVNPFPLRSRRFP